jgi:hypothetical protein
LRDPDGEDPNQSELPVGTEEGSGDVHWFAGMTGEGQKNGFKKQKNARRRRFK